MRKIEPAELTLKPFHLLDEEWALLVGGRERPNPMTVSWGGFGTLWNRPMATVYVRPTRHTYKKLLEHREFTVNFLPPEMKAALELCGAKSGRDIDKWKAAGLKRVKSEHIDVPRVGGARLALECRIAATLDFDPQQFFDRSVERNYPKKDYHRLFFGEVLAVWVGDSWR